MRAGSSRKVNHLLSVPQSRDQCLNQSSNQNKCSSLRGFWLWYCRLVRWAEVVRPLPFPPQGWWGGVGRGREEDGGWRGVRPASQRRIGGKLSRTEPTCRNLGVTHLCTSGAPPAQLWAVRRWAWGFHTPTSVPGVTGLEGHAEQWGTQWKLPLPEASCSPPCSIRTVPELTLAISIFYLEDHSPPVLPVCFQLGPRGSIHTRASQSELLKCRPSWKSFLSFLWLLKSASAPHHGPQDRKVWPCPTFLAAPPLPSLPSGPRSLFSSSDKVTSPGTPSVCSLLPRLLHFSPAHPPRTMTLGSLSVCVYAFVSDAVLLTRLYSPEMESSGCAPLGITGTCLCVRAESVLGNLFVVSESPVSHWWCLCFENPGSML